MAKYRSRVNLRLKDGRRVTPSTGLFECSDEEAIELIKNNWIVQADAPMVAGLAEETVNQQAAKIKELEQVIAEKEKQILELQKVINVREADIEKMIKKK